MGAFVRVGLFVLVLFLFAGEVHADVGTSTAEMAAIEHFGATEIHLPVTSLAAGSDSRFWYLTNFWRNDTEAKKWYFEGRVIVDPKTGKVAGSNVGTSSVTQVYMDMWELYPINIIDEDTGETGFNFNEDDALAYALSAVQIPPDYTIYSRGLKAGPTQMYYVFDFVRYDQYYQKTYWGMRLIVEPYTGEVVGDPEVLRAMQARSIDVPEGFDPRTKELVTSVSSTFASFSTRALLAICLGVLAVLLVVLLVYRKFVRHLTFSSVDYAFIFAIVAQIAAGIFLYVFSPGSYFIGWLLLGALGTVTTWVTTRATLKVGTTAEELRVIKPSELPKFSDVGGMDSVKEEIRNTVGIIVRHGEKARAMGISFNGILLYGPPGVGKTFIARASAGEYGLNFISVKVSDMTSMYYSGSTQMIASVFKKAAQSSPCLLFFDEFDSVAQERSQGGLAVEDTRIVNQLLSMIESVRTMPGTVIVMAATNNKDDLDEAVIRPGRFDRHIMIPLPDADARKLIIERILKGKPIAKDIDTAELAKISEGMSAAELDSAIEKAVFGVLNASLDSKDSKISITQDNLRNAFRNLYARQKQTVKDIGWEDLILEDETKNTLKRLVNLIENPDLTEKLGIDAPRGALLSGPPGTGKTTIARVIANEAHTSFVSISAADIYSKWIGESEQKIKKLFDEARRHKPSVIFIDEIDAVMRTRGGASDQGNQYLDNVTNQILQEIDGIKDSSGVFVIGATNRPELIDPALLRGGRLSERIEIPLPELSNRIKILDLYLRKAKVDPAVDKKLVAGHAVGLSGADIKAIVQQAILTAYERGKDALVTQADLMNAIENTTMGHERKLKTMSDEEKRYTAYHEAGHALVGSLLPHCSPVTRVTIVSRGHALGVTYYYHDESKMSFFRADYLDEIARSLGGYVAEKLVLGDISSGASSDLQNANKMARDMVTQYGMSDSIGAAISVQGEAADKEVRTIIDRAYKKAEEVLTQHRSVLDVIAQQLLEKETLEQPVYEKILTDHGIALKNAEAKASQVAQLVQPKT